MRRKLLKLQEECGSKKHRVPMNVAEPVHVAQELLRSADVLVTTVLSLKVPVTAEGDTTQLAADLNKAKVSIFELESGESINVRRNEGRSEEGTQRHPAKIRVWKATIAKIADCLINDVEVANADSLKMSAGRNLILARF